MPKEWAGHCVDWCCIFNNLRRLPDGLRRDTQLNSGRGIPHWHVVARTSVGLTFAGCLIVRRAARAHNGVGIRKT